MQIPGAWRVKKAIRKISRKYKTADLVLMYHRVATPKFDPWRLSVSSENFSSQLAWLKDNCQVINLEGLVGKPKTVINNKARVVITFDDGYSDNFEVAYPLLNKYKLPATIFISTGYIGRKGLYWWDDLVRVVLETQEVPKNLILEDVQGKKYQFSLEGGKQFIASESVNYKSWMPWEPAPTTRHQLYYDLWKLFRESDALNISKFQDQLYKWAGVSAEGNKADWPMTVEQLKYIAGDDLVQIGGHTINHYSFKNISLEQQNIELEGAKDQLEKWINAKINTFSYPFGDYTEESEGLVKNAGYKVACTTSPHCYGEGYTSFYVPRFEVHDWNGNALGDKINSWIINRK
jgi:peptidoglycan/xylan/chitin deacetylase (PgdA/CDA1 family)